MCPSGSPFDRKFRTAKRSTVTQTLPSGWVRLVRARRVVRRFWGGLSQCYFAPGDTNVFAEPITVPALPYLSFIFTTAFLTRAIRGSLKGGYRKFWIICLPKEKPSR